MVSAGPSTANAGTPGRFPVVGAFREGAAATSQPKGAPRRPGQSEFCSWSAGTDSDFLFGQPLEYGLVTDRRAGRGNTGNKRNAAACGGKGGVISQQYVVRDRTHRVYGMIDAAEN
jgi:hypothetical protein